MKYASYSAATKGKKLPSFETQELQVAVRNKMREHLLPEEIIAMIFVFANSEKRKRIPSVLDSLRETYSIWWKPSRRLKELCGERGALQPYHYDVSSVFPSYIPFKHNPLYVGLSSFEKEDIFNLRRCSHYPQEGCCIICVAYKFPCATCSDTGACQSIWDVSDEPRVSSHTEYLDLRWEGWRDEINAPGLE